MAAKTPKEIEREFMAQQRREKLKKLGTWLLDYLPYVILAAVAVFAVVYLSRPGSPALKEDAVTVFLLDVGQGDSVLIHTPSHNVLIDAGEYDQGAGIVQKLRALGISSLDYVINSHPHSDHIGGMADVLKMMPVKAVYFPDIPETLIPPGRSYSDTLDVIAEKGIPLRIARNQETLLLGIAELTFLSVDNTQFENLNDCSLGCLLKHESCTFFFGGDLETDGETAFCDAGLIPPLTVLKCSHHGSKTSTTKAFLDAASPAAAVISVGATNDYGHPAPETLARLREYTDLIFRTDLHGDIRMVSDGTEADITPNVRIG